MSYDDDSQILPPRFEPGQRPQANRAMLGVLLVLLGIAVLLTLWVFLFRDDGDSVAEQPAIPTPLPLPTSTSLPVVTVPDDTAVEPTTPPVAATPVPAGFEACPAAEVPLTTGTYIVDTLETPLNQRVEPAVTAEQSGTFDPGETGLVFTGECIVNATDGYTWWRINNGTADVWIASDFVSPN